MTELIYLITGLIIGAAIVLIIYRFQKRDADKLAKELVSQVHTDKFQDLDNFLQRIKESFDSVSMEALSKSLTQHMEIAKNVLSEQSALGAKDIQGKKDLISQTFDSMKEELDKVGGLMKEFEKERQAKYSELSTLLTGTGNELNRLTDTTTKLTTALVRTQVRGNWGERMAEDVLNLAGFIKNVNYYKQKNLETESGRPDFTFVLPNDQKINMDVKFPFNNYWSFLETDNDVDKQRYKNLFIRDVKKHIKILTSREYINPAENTIDMVIMFIPNEQVYSFINENDRSVLDEAIKNKVALCSPLTLFAILAIIRQAVDNFSLEKTANKIITLLNSFYKQWELYKTQMGKMGKRIEDAQKEYNNLVAARTNKLQKPLDEIERLRRQKGLPASANNELDIDKLDYPHFDD